MKTITLTILAACFAAGLLFAQGTAKKSSTFKTKFTGKKIVLRLETAQVSIEGYNGDEIIIEAENAPQIPEEAKGLRPLSTGGTDNTGLGLAAVTTNGIMTISTVLKSNDSDEPTKYKFRIPRQLSVSYKQGNGWCNCDEAIPVMVSNMDGEVEIKTTDLGINFINVTGPIVANSTNGKIKVIYDDKISDKPSSFASYDGNIDISVSDKAKVAFGVNTGYGSRSNVFTDLDLKTVTTTEKKEDKSKDLVTKVEVSYHSLVAPKPPKAPKAPRMGDMRVTSATVRDSASRSEFTFTDSSGVTDPLRMAMDLNQMSMDIANGELADLSDLNTANDYGKKSTSYVLNDGKTKISIRTSNGNVFLRKK
jgi:hypothetical protein